MAALSPDGGALPREIAAKSGTDQVFVTVAGASRNFALGDLVEAPGTRTAGVIVEAGRLALEDVLVENRLIARVPPLRDSKRFSPKPLTLPLCLAGSCLVGNLPDDRVFRVPDPGGLPRRRQGGQSEGRFGYEAARPKPVRKINPPTNASQKCAQNCSHDDASESSHAQAPISRSVVGLRPRAHDAMIRLEIDRVMAGPFKRLGRPLQRLIAVLSDRHAKAKGRQIALPALYSRPCVVGD